MQYSTDRDDLKTPSDLDRTPLAASQGKRVSSLRKVTPKQHLVALAAAAGKSNIEIGHMLGLQPASISQIKRLPMVRALIEKTQKEIRSSTVTNITDMFLNEGPKSVETLVELRDDEDTPAAVRLGATKELIARNPSAPAPRTAQDIQTKTQIVIDREGLDLLQRAMLEGETGEVIDITPPVPLRDMDEEEIYDMADEEQEDTGEIEAEKVPLVQSKVKIRSAEELKKELEGEGKKGDWT